MKKLVSKNLSLLLALVMIVSLVPMNAFATGGVTVSSIEVVEAKDLYETADGFTTGYNATSDANGDFYYYYYDSSNVNLKITYTDGTVKYSDYSDTIDDCYISSLDTQYQQKWTKGGKNTVTFEYMGKTCEYDVQILDTPVSSIEVVEAKDLYETGYNAGYNDTSDANGDFYYYYYGWLDVNLKITYTDGTVKYSDYSNTIDDEYDDCYISSLNTQYQQKWTKGGKNTVTFEYMGKTCEYDVQILDSPVSSIEVVEAKDLYENAGGQNATSDANGDFYYYSYDSSNVNLKITYTDGTVKYSDYIHIVDDEYDGYYISSSDTQDEQKWTKGGTNTVTFEYMGKTCEYDVQIVDSPVASIEVVEAKDLYETADGFTTGYNATSDANGDFYYYSYDSSNVNLKITYTDGTVKYSDYSNTIDDEYYGCYILSSDTQYEQKWIKGGKNTVTFEYMGKTCEYDVQIVDSPVASIEVVEARDLYENAGGYNATSDANGDFYYYSYNSSNVNLKITYTDGTVKYSNYDWMVDDEYDDCYISSLNTQYEQKWTKGGKNTVTFEYMGKTCEYDVQILDSPVVSIEVVEAKDLYENAGGRNDTSDANGDFYYYYYGAYSVNLKITYTDGTVKYSNYDWTVDDEYDYNISCPNTQDEQKWTKGGTNTVTFEYMGKTCEYDVQILDNPVSSVNILEVPQQNSFETGFTSDFIGMKFEINYTDGSKDTVTVSEDNIVYIYGTYTVDVDGNDCEMWYDEDGYYISYLGAYDSYAKSITEIEKDVSNVSVSNVSETGDGMTVSVKYSDGTSYDFTVDVHENSTYSYFDRHDNYKIVLNYTLTDKGVAEFYIETYYDKNGEVDYYVVGIFGEEIKGYPTISVVQAADGNWYSYKYGAKVNYTGFATNDNGTWYVENGKVTFKKNDIIKDTDGTWKYVVNSKFTKTNTVAKNSLGWWRVENGIVNFKATGVFQNSNGWWYCKNGKVDFGYTGIQKNSNGWWRIVDGKVDFSATGVYQNELGWWYCKNGKVDFSYTGIKSNSNGWWRIVNGKVDFSANGVYQNENGWWKVENGKVNFGFTGIASNSNGRWYCVDGKVDFSKNGRVRYQGTTYNIRGGKVV